MNDSQNRLNGKIKIVVIIEWVIRAAGNTSNRGCQATDERMISDEMCNRNNTGEACYKFICDFKRNRFGSKGSSVRIHGDSGPVFVFCKLNLNAVQLFLFDS